MALYRRVIRIVILHTGLHCRAYSRRHVRKTLTEGRPLPPPKPAERHPHFWFELRDDTDHAIYWRTMWRPFMHTIETTSGQRPGQLRHLENPNVRGAFDMLIPDVPAAHHIVLFSSPLDASGVLQPAVEVFRADVYSIREVP